MEDVKLDRLYSKEIGARRNAAFRSSITARKRKA